MKTAQFSDIFGIQLEENIFEEIKKAEIKKCNLDIDRRTLEVSLKPSCYIERKHQFEIKRALINALRLNSLSDTYIFESDMLCEKACSDAAEELKLKNAAVNGYLTGAEFSLDNGKLTVTLKHGGFKRLVETKFETALVNLLKERFNIEVAVEFAGQLEDVEMEIPPIEVAPPKAEKKNDSAPKEKSITFEKREEKPKNGIVYLDNPKVFYGRRIDNNTKPMIEVTGDDTEICCWGEVFGVEQRKINTKRGEMVVFSFSFSDHTNSLSASMFMDPKKMGDVALVKDGNYILVNGSYEFDNYKKSLL